MGHVWRIFAIVVLVVIAAVLGLVGSIVNIRMLNSVNAKRPRELQFDSLGWHAAKHYAMRDEYARLYPDGPLLWQSNVISAVVMLCAVGIAALMFHWI